MIRSFLSPLSGLVQSSGVAIRRNCTAAKFGTSFVRNAIMVQSPSYLSLCSPKLFSSSAGGGSGSDGGATKDDNTNMSMIPSSGTTTAIVSDDTTPSSSVPDFGLTDMSFLHHGLRPRYRNYEKFKIPRKRASKLFHELTVDTMTKSKSAKPEVFDVPYEVGDAVEFELIEMGGINSTETSIVRGIVIGIFNKKMDSSVLIRDVVQNIPIERKIKLHSPLVKSCKILEKNFVYKGKRKVKRAKLYFLRDRNPSESRVTDSRVTRKVKTSAPTKKKKKKKKK